MRVVRDPRDLPFLIPGFVRVADIIISMTDMDADCTEAFLREANDREVAYAAAEYDRDPFLVSERSLLDELARLGLEGRDGRRARFAVAASLAAANRYTSLDGVLVTAFIDGARWTVSCPVTYEEVRRASVFLSDRWKALKTPQALVSDMVWSVLDGRRGLPVDQGGSDFLEAADRHARSAFGSDGRIAFMAGVSWALGWREIPDIDYYRMMYGQAGSGDAAVVRRILEHYMRVCGEGFSFVD